MPSINVGETTQITVHIQDQYLFNNTDQEIAGYLKLYTALLMFKSGKLTDYSTCEFASVDRYTFLSTGQQHYIATLDYDDEHKIIVTTYRANKTDWHKNKSH